MTSTQENIENMSFAATSNGNADPLRKQIELQRLLNQTQSLQKDIKEKLSEELDSLFDQFLTDVEQNGGLQEQNQNYVFRRQSSKSERCSLLREKYKRTDGELPDKVFLPRRSVLTELFEINHIKTIYHMFIAILIVFCLNTFVYDIVHEGRINLSFDLMRFALGKLSKVMEIWVMMNFGTLLILYPAFYYWSNYRPLGPARWYDYVALCTYIGFMIAFLVLPIQNVLDYKLPPASSLIIACEQLRLIMKMHSFVRENIPRVLKYKYKKDDDSDDDTLCPDFSKYLYFLFVPTLIYRDNYPRTTKIRWNYVVTNFAQVVTSLFYIYYIFVRFCVPYFQNFNQEHVTPKLLVMTMFGCMLPGTLVLFIGFFAILHSWFNAFAEMLRFADRMFYKDWWNSTSFSNYYRTWNVVVHDWLYTYVYKDVCKLVGTRNRPAAMACVFVFSAIFHEYVLVLCFNFLYPVLLVMFAGAGFGFIFLTDKGVARSWNVFLWFALFTGTGILMCLYSMEWYARINCPVNTDNILDKLIPRSWTCNFEAMENHTKPTL